MTKQLTLITSPAGRPQAWRLDERTRRIGRKGLAEARAALVDARRGARAPDPPRPSPPLGDRQRPAA
jgi:hypothetical protein